MPPLVLPTGVLRVSRFISSNGSTIRSRYQSFPPWTMRTPATVGLAFSATSPWASGARPIT